MRTHHYPSDVTDEQWALIEPHITAAPPGGRPRKTDMRDVVDAILYLLRTGCQWRYLPGDLPPKGEIYGVYTTDSIRISRRDLAQREVSLAKTSPARRCR